MTDELKKGLEALANLKNLAPVIRKRTPHDGTAPVGDTSRNNLSWWFPKLVAAGLPVPVTRFVSMGNYYTIGDALFDGKESPVTGALIEMLGHFGNEVGWPCFLRTGYFSGKHDWENCCYVKDQSRLPGNLCTLANMQEMCGVMEGDSLSTWCIRELLPTHSEITCERYGNFPVTREIRVFVHDDQVVYDSPYWPEDAIAKGMPAERDWKDWLPLATTFEDEEIEEVRELASAAGKACGGSWSVDILATKRGWFITDMAEADRSYGYDDAKYKERLEEKGR